MISYPSASIVIPTWNRLEDLRLVVAALDEDWLPPAADVELVVVDDGSSDGTWRWLEARRGRIPCTPLRQDNSGPARARNLGCEAARGELVLFLGDDTVPQPGWLMAHLEQHRLFADLEPVAVLGYTSFPPHWDRPFLRFINEYGAQFGYALIDRPLAVEFKFFYTSNISLPRRFLLDSGGFREDFPAAAWEDIEFAYRAVGEGLRLHYQPRARVIHRHRVRARTFCLRQRTVGRSAAIFAGLHPELEDFLGVNRLRALPAAPRLRASLLAVLVGAAEAVGLALPSAVYQQFLDLYYLEGLAGGLQAG